MEFGEYHHLFPQLKKYPDRFFQYTRMDYSTFEYILNLISPHMEVKYTNFVKQPIECDEKLLITLRYLATGASFRSLSFTFRIGASTVSKIVIETEKQLWNVLQPIHMLVPTSDTFLRTSQEFYNIWNFPNCIGCIDVKHVRIISPPHSGTMFYNYKKFYSIALQGVCDAQYRFSMIDVGGFGKQNDGATLAASDMYLKIKNNQLNIPDDSYLPGTYVKTSLVFLGDEAYPLSLRLLTPYPADNLTMEKTAYNFRHSRARKTIECTFGILYSKWRILSKSIEAKHETADHIVKAVCVLQNTIIDREGFERHLSEVIPGEKTRGYTEPVPRRRGRHLTAAMLLRDTFKAYFQENPIKFKKDNEQ
ncbi:protein ALP1-like isoform X2 [Homalodisca vitripennis]|nr:protein ALP1-like isoform X2 [Homalodisca vitripennis]